jgi:diguanylate cyclase (GGDEF)-like protein
MEIINLVSKDFRKDSCTNAGTSLSFFEWIQEIKVVNNFCLLLIEITDSLRLDRDSESYFHDKYWKWVGQVLDRDVLSKIFRLGKCEFVVILNENCLADQKQLAESIIIRLNKEAKQFNINEPVAKGILVTKGVGENFSQFSIFDLLRIASQELSHVPIGSTKYIQGQSTQSDKNLSWLIKNISVQMVELGKKIDETYHLVNTDPLTGLPNLRAALEELDYVYSSSKISNDQFAVIMVDGDGLKEMNKSGYETGDKYICQLAEIQKSGLRNGDFLARWRMGDEFLVILKNTSSEMAHEIAERLRYMVEQASESWVMPVTISLGLAVYPDHAITIDELLFKAEKALTLAKERGKNQIVYADEIYSI